MDNIFKHFPEKAICPLCKTNDDKACCLIPIDGTEKGNICEAKPMHVECVTAIKGFRYNKEYNVLYHRFPE